jgi:hypothetical protein
MLELVSGHFDPGTFEVDWHAWPLPLTNQDFYHMKHFQACFISRHHNQEPHLNANYHSIAEKIKLILFGSC